MKKFTVIGNSDGHHCFPIGEYVFEKEGSKSFAKNYISVYNEFGENQHILKDDLYEIFPWDEPLPDHSKKLKIGGDIEELVNSNILLMAHLYHSGLSFRDVAQLTGVHERTVRRRFKKWGVPSRPPQQQ